MYPEYLLKTIHVAGVILIFTSLGATLLANSNSKIASILHGIAALVVLLTGFAILKKPPMDQYWWMVKVVMWLFIGIAPLLAKRKVLHPMIVLALTIAAGVVAAWMGIYLPKPL